MPFLIVSKLVPENRGLESEVLPLLFIPRCMEGVYMKSEICTILLSPVILEKSLFKVTISGRKPWSMDHSQGLTF